MTDEIKPWRHVSTTKLADTRVFSLHARVRRSETTGNEAEFYVIDAQDWVNVVAVTADDQLVCVEQYRHGVERVTLEIPGGMIDETDATPLEAAKRELLEETGFASDEWKHIGTVDPNPAIQTNRCFTFLASNARRVAEPSPDGNEEIRVVLERIADVPALLRSGRVEHALVVAALLWWMLASAGDDSP